MQKIRLGILGMGNMGGGHFYNVREGKCPSVEVTAICDLDSTKLERFVKEQPEVAAFTDAKEMLDSGLVDAVLVAVPHYDHPAFSMECFERNIHVLTEKPAGVYTRQVREMNAAAERSGLVFGIMFNQRTNPLYAKARQIVQSGELGVLKRMVWIITNWYRTQAYYDSGNWRATWNGEGGGVLLNQAPHNLDLWQWIFGMPKRVRAFCDFGKYHNIGVEDDVTIFGEYENGATATFISTTGDACGTNRLEITGDKGKIVIENGVLKWWKLNIPEREFCFTSNEGFASPGSTYEEIQLPSPEGHPQVLEAFAQAILHGTEMIADGREGLNSLMISNAAYLSTWTDDWVEIGTGEELFEQYLMKLCDKENIAQKRKSTPESYTTLRERWKVRW